VGAPCFFEAATPKATLALVGVLLSAGALLWVQTEYPTGAYAVGGIAPLYALLILCLYWNVSILSRVLAHKWLQFLGEASYAIYLLQMPVMMIALAQFKRHGFDS
jgi:peptidoglycan/LPS O-acetylase OafA/YrhL